MRKLMAKKAILLVAIALLTLLKTGAAFAEHTNSPRDTVARESAPRWAISTNLPTWGVLATLNTNMQVALDTHWSFTACVKYNPFTNKRGRADQFHLRQLTPSLGVRYWKDETFRGWFLEGKVLGSVYSVANICGSGCFDGQLIGVGLGAGWNKPLGERWALTLGAGVAAAYHNTTFYAAPACGRIVGRKKGAALFVSDLMVSINYLL